MDPNTGQYFVLYTFFASVFIFSLLALLVSLAGTMVLLIRGLLTAKLDYSGPWATPRALLFKRTRRWALWTVIFLTVTIGGFSGLKLSEDKAMVDGQEMRRQIDEGRLMTPGKLLEKIWEKLTQ